MEINCRDVIRVIRSFLTGCCLVFLICGLSPTASALELQLGEAYGSWDTTVSYGLGIRTEDIDSHIVGIPNGGRAYSVNADDGNLNYDRGVFSNAAKITSELELNMGRFGVFVRGTGFYDFENEEEERRRTELSDRALELVGSDVKLLDAYISAALDVWEMPLDIRVGEQVVSWGEGTFIPHGINVINPVDVSALRLPGAELREAFLPQGMVWGMLGATEAVSLEAYYQYDWDETIIDPPGSYFSSNDFVGEGGSRVQLGFGGAPEGDFLGVPRAATRDADEQGQFGIAMRVFAPELNNTEFGFYFVNHHSALPLISARTGTAAGATAATAIGVNTPALTTAALTQLGIAPGDPTGAITAGVLNGMGNGMTQDQAGLIAQTVVQTSLATGGNVAAINAAAATAAATSATDAYARTARYRTEYPEDINVWGTSFNTEIGTSGIALQGEYSFHDDVPMQIDDIELLFATLGAINAGLDANNQVENYLGRSYLGEWETDIPGYIERDMSQVQATLTKAISRVAGADQLIMLGELGLTYVHDMPDTDELRLDGPGTFISGNQVLAGYHGPAAGQMEGEDHFATSTSWGYRAAAKLVYNDVWAGINLMPRIAWQHDVQGITPRPMGTFLQGRRAVTYGLEAVYRQVWSLDMSYTSFFGADDHNLINDRDFVSATIKYSF